MKFRTRDFRFRTGARGVHAGRNGQFARDRPPDRAPFRRHDGASTLRDVCSRPSDRYSRTAPSPSFRPRIAAPGRGRCDSFPPEGLMRWTLIVSLGWLLLSASAPARAADHVWVGTSGSWTDAAAFSGVAVSAAVSRHRWE